jgi:choline kinase
MPRIIIMAAGSGKRWTGDKPKQMTEFDGEPLIYRTIRLLLEAGIEKRDIVLTISDALHKAIPYGNLFSVLMFKPQNNDQEIDRFLSCKPMWDDDTLFLYGDVYYTSEAISQILTTYARPVTFYGRRRGNDVKRYGEMFALRADTKDSHFLEVLNGIRVREIAGQARGLGWDVYRAYEKRNFIELDPRVEDFDYVSEVETYKKIYGIR